MTLKSIYKTSEGKEQIHSFYNEVLQQWYQPSKQHLIKTLFGETFIIESGSQENYPILVLHGSGSNSAMWTADVWKLSEKYRVFAIDIIGECGKSAENRPEFKSDNYSTWINEICEKFQLKKVSIIGNSLGGWIAIDFAIKFPEKVEKLVLLATGGITPIKGKIIFWIIITSFFGKWGFNQLNKMVYGNLDINKKAEDFALLVKENYIPRTDVIPIFTNNFLQRIKASVLFIGGENDCFYNSNKTTNRLKTNLKNADCHVLKDTGHVLINQTNRIMKFLNSGKNEL